MKNIKTNKILLTYLAIIVVLAMPLALVKADDEKENPRNNPVNIQNKHEANQGIASREKEEDKNKVDDEFDGEMHTSNVATFIKNLLEVANKEKKDVSEDIKTIVVEQSSSRDEISAGINKINTRSKFKTFFIGTDFKNIGQLRSSIVKTDDNIKKLNEVLTKTTNAETKTVIQEQIKTLEADQQKIDDLIKTNESKFSLFGWFVKLINK